MSPHNISTPIKGDYKADFSLESDLLTQYSTESPDSATSVTSGSESDHDHSEVTDFNLQIPDPSTSSIVAPIASISDSIPENHQVSATSTNAPTAIATQASTQASSATQGNTRPRPLQLPSLGLLRYSSYECFPDLKAFQNLSLLERSFPALSFIICGQDIF